jgi:hypothetical protein
MKFFENPFQVKFEQQAAEQSAAAELNAQTGAAKAAAKVFADKPFTLEYKGIYLASNGLKLAANGVSFAAALFCFGELLGAFLGAYIGYALGFAASICLEFLKNKAFGAFFKNWLKYKRFTVVALAAAFGLSIVSIASSGYGAYTLPSKAAKPEPFNYVPTSQDSAVLGQINGLDAKIQAFQEQAKANSTNTHAGKITRTAMAANAPILEQITSLEAERKTLEAERKEFKERAAAAAAAADTEAAEHLQFKQYAAAAAALVFEALYLLCVGFGFYYLFRAYLEAEPAEAAEAEQSPVQSPVQSQRPIIERQAEAEPQAATAKAPKPIGFNNLSPNLPQGKEGYLRAKSNYHANLKRSKEAKTAEQRQHYKEKSEAWLKLMQEAKAQK